MIKCEVIQDLLPLYQDEVASAESAALIEEHIESCPDCKAYLDALRSSGLSERVDIDNTEIGALRIMKKKMRRKALIMSLVGALLALVIVIASIALFGFRFPMSFLLGSETIGIYEMAAMRESRMLAEASMDLVVCDEDGNPVIEIQFPLPNGAVPFENEAYPVHEGNKQYLITHEAFQHYRNELLEQYGYKIADQMGAWIWITNEEDFVQVEISTAMFTRDYMRMEILEVTSYSNVP